MKKKRRVSCPIKHVNFYIVSDDETGKHSVKCVNRELCKDTCPYLSDPDFKYLYKRAPDYKEH